MPGRPGPKEFGSNWPDVVRQSWDALWEVDVLMRWQMRNVKCPPAPATAQEISEMDEALAWLSLIPGQDTRRVVWARACDIRWEDISDQLDKSRQWLWLLYSAGLRVIVRSLNNGHAPGR